MRQDFKKFGVFDAQEELERKQRREEDELYGEMVAERRRQMQLLEQVLAAEREHTVSELIAWFESRGTAQQERDDSLNKVASRTCIAYNSVATAHTLVVVSTNAKYISNTARIVCAAGAMKRYGVRPFVRLSVCPIRPLRQRAAGLLLWARRVGDIDRLLHGRRRCSTGSQHHAQQQMRVVPRF